MKKDIVVKQGTVKGYKGFDKDLKCRDFQYKLGKTFEHKGDVKLCHTGLHFCENPLDVFGYYPPASRFAEVEGELVAETEKGGDSKRAAKRLHIGVEVFLSQLIGVGVKFILDRVDFANAKESNTGDQSASTNTGDRSASTNTGYRSASTNTGEEGYAASLGIEGKASGAIGCWLTLAEWEYISDVWHRIDVQTTKVDGKDIKANTFYMLRGGDFVEASNQLS